MECGWKKWKPDMPILDQPREPLHGTNATFYSNSTDKKRKTSGGSSRLCASCDVLLPALQNRNKELKIQLEEAQQEQVRRNYEYETLAAKNHEQSRELESMRKATERNAQMALLEIELLELKGQLADKTSECEFLEKKNAKQARELEALRGKRIGTSSQSLHQVANFCVHAARAHRTEPSPPEASKIPEVPTNAAETSEEALWDDILAPTDENRSFVMQAVRGKSKHSTCKDPRQVRRSIVSLVAGSMPHPMQAHRDAFFHGNKENVSLDGVTNEPMR